MPVGEEFVDINSRIRESLVRYVSKVIRISSTRNEDGTDSADTSTVAPQYVQQEGRSNATEGGTLSTSSAVSDGFTIDPSGNMLLNLEIGLFPVNYELSFGQNVRRKLS